MLPGRGGPIVVRGVDAADRTTLVEAFARPGGLNGALMAAFANRRDLEVFASVLV